jgi:hypothetical protein
LRFRRGDESFEAARHAQRQDREIRSAMALVPGDISAKAPTTGAITQHFWPYSLSAGKKAAAAFGGSGVCFGRRQ